jgi:hypothetical protein
MLDAIADLPFLEVTPSHGRLSYAGSNSSATVARFSAE